MRRDDLKNALAEMTLEEIQAIKTEVQTEREAEQIRREAGRSNDPLGTIRYADDVMWVRIAGSRWDPYPADRHGLSMADHEVPWSTWSLVGMMPEPWIIEQQNDELEYP